MPLQLRGYLSDDVVWGSNENQLSNVNYILAVIEETAMANCPR
jgi:hypothetical protein